MKPLKEYIANIIHLVILFIILSVMFPTSVFMLWNDEEEERQQPNDH